MDHEFGVICERDLPVVMRDGTKLVADVHRPDAEGTFPTIVMRVPYHKRMATPMHYVNYFAPRGFVVVVQDTRGRFKSEGEYYPLVDEVADGYDTVEWAAALPWSNGRVGTAGQSYHAATQYLLARTQPPHLECIAPVSAPSTFLRSWVFHDGAFELGWQMPYVIAMARHTADRIGKGPAYQEWLNEFVEPEGNLFQPLKPKYYQHLPLMDWADWLGETAPYLRDYFERSEDSAYWHPLDIPAHHAEMDVPALHVGSWYDMFQDGPFEHFTGLNVRGGARGRGAQRLLVGPWGHISPYAEPTTGGAGEIEFGPAAAVPIHDVEHTWFNHWLRSDRTEGAPGSPVRLFVMGKNEWRDENEWPIARTEYRSFYLHSDGSARTLSGDGRLSESLPGQEPTDEFVYDPADPVPTRGGNTVALPMGVYDQREVEARPDVLCYTSATLSEEMEVTGRIQLELWAASSAVDTDFTGKLVVVRPEGYAQNLADGIVRARYRDGQFAPSLLEPGKPYSFTIDLGFTSYLFQAGDRIRLDVSSSNFPRFDRNLNTGGNPFTDSRIETARQTVFHSVARPSRLVLPVVR